MGVRKVLAVGLFLLTFMSDAMGAERGTVLEERRMHSRILGQDLHYTVYLPPEYDEGNRRFPVVFMMHGSWGGRHEDWFRYGETARLLDRMIEAGEMPPVIAISPDGRRDEEASQDTYYMNDADRGFRWEDMFVEEFIDHVDTTYRTFGTRKGRTIVGLSMGGHAATALSVKYPDLFSGAATLSGSFRTQNDIIALDQAGYDSRYGKAWGEGLSGSDRLNDAYRQNDVLQLVAARSSEDLAGVKHYIDCGSDDPFFAGNAELHLKLRERGIAHRFMIREGGHEWDYWRSGLPGALAFVADVLRR